MNSSFEAIQKYCESQSTSQSDVLHALERETHLKTLVPRMLSGHLQGQLMKFISIMLQPTTILEIGTFTGYSSLCLAEGLKEGGLLHTIDVNPETNYIVQKYIAQAGLQDKIKTYTGKAEEIIPTIEATFDLVFIDAGKKDYTYHYNIVFDKVRKGGWILADNVLWNGKVVAGDDDKKTKALHEFNTMVQCDNRVENMILPIRDGIMIARKL